MIKKRSTRALNDMLFIFSILLLSLATTATSARGYVRGSSLSSSLSLSNEEQEQKEEEEEEFTEDDLRLRDYAMIMAHDAATLYLCDDDHDDNTIFPSKKQHGVVSSSSSSSSILQTMQDQVLEGRETDGAIRNLMCAFAQTQSPSSNIASLLSCGARSLDLRPYVLADGTLVSHHGKVPINHAFSDSLDEIVSWCEENPSELVILDIWSCITTESSTNAADDELCLNLLSDLLETKGIPVVSDCDDVDGITVREAKRMGELNPAGGGGGSLLVIRESSGTKRCSKDNYSQQINCWGLKSAHDDVDNDSGSHSHEEEFLGNIKNRLGYCCHESCKNKEKPLAALSKYLLDASESNNKVLNLLSPPPPPLYQLQALWQETTESVALGAAFSSSLLLDEEKSNLHLLIATMIDEQLFDGKNRGINFLEVNNICHGNGYHLQAAIKGFNRRQVVQRRQEELQRSSQKSEK